MGHRSPPAPFDKHVLMVEQDSLKRMAVDQAAREPPNGAESAQPS